MRVRAGDISGLTTEKSGERFRELSSMPVRRIMELINREDRKVAAAVGRAMTDICRAAEAVSGSINEGGRVFYVAAGTGGRVAAQDAAELRPTFGFTPRQFQVIMAGGPSARTRAVENAEDDAEYPVRELSKRKVGPEDVVLGLSASGRTPFVLSALKYASSRGCATICLTSNAKSPITGLADIAIVVETGPEVVAGSTRMKAGTAQKMVLNMISTYAGIRAGKVVGNRMVGMLPTNEKLRKRAVEIVMDVSSCSSLSALKALKATGYDIRKAIENVRGR